MGTKQEIRLFEEKRVRSLWDSDTEEWYFSVVDVVEVLTDSADPKQYIKKMRRRDAELNVSWGTICTLTPLTASDGKRYKTTVANCEGIFRIIQSIPSPKAEPFKQWMAAVAAERLNQMQDPERSIDQAMTDYRRLGYSERWITQRLRSIEVRKELTDEWKRGGITESRDFASLTDIILQTWSGKRTKQYKSFKGLKKENLRDNMTNVELALNTLAEVSTTEIARSESPTGLYENADVARRGGNIAKTARLQLEEQTGRSALSPAKASDYILPEQPKKKLEKEEGREG